MSASSVGILGGGQLGSLLAVAAKTEASIKPIVETIVETNAPS